ncbi:family S53 protease-like protein [Mycena crocata]|nr:family S53 protease-like protein [Mycena crocata]
MLASQALFTFFLSFPLLVASTPVARPILQDIHHTVPRGFVSLGEAPSSKSITLNLALASDNIAALEQLLLNISTPSSPNYGKYLSGEEVRDMSTNLEPSPDTVAAVQDWCSAHNVSCSFLGVARDWISFTVPVATANKMLYAKYETFQHMESGTEYTRTLGYSLPAHVAEHIDHVHPSTGFGRPRGRVSIPASPRSHQSEEADSNPCVDANGGTTVTPACLQFHYGIPSAPAAHSMNNSIAVAGFNHEAAQKADLEMFLRKFPPDMCSDTTFGLHTLNGGDNPQFDPSHFGNTGEALDIQYTIGLATGVPVEFVSVGGGDNLDVAEYFLTLDETIPKVLTTSYGSDESRNDTTGYPSKLCTKYAALGLRGVSVLFASGDGGTAETRNNNDTCKQIHNAFIPTFPSGCPFITSVYCPSINILTAATLSGGGFSNIWSVSLAPEYQKKAISTYLSQIGSVNGNRYNAGGRGYPDVSAPAGRLPVVSKRTVGDSGGTSASSPVFASVIALLNDQLIAAGKPQLGFLNPWLYAHPEAFNDIIEGNNDACGNSGDNGFSAEQGWDPVTGLGSPNFEAMKKAAGL